jgi:hypothetical protein
MRVKLIYIASCASNYSKTAVSSNSSLVNYILLYTVF